MKLFRQALACLFLSIPLLAASVVASPAQTPLPRDSVYQLPLKLTDQREYRAKVLGSDSFRSDVLASGGLDDRKSSNGYLSRAEQLMADAVGAEQALHSVGYLYESAGCDLCASLSRCCH